VSESSQASIESASVSTVPTSAKEPSPGDQRVASTETSPSSDDAEAARTLAATRHALMAEIGKRIVGQQNVIDHLLIALFSRGHCLFVGVPGLAKTMLIQTLADILDLSFGRIQFTPDLMPSDITGSDVLEEDRTTGKRVFRFVKGPVFANVILADEINRTPPKTQAALLQAMQERRVSAGGTTYPLPNPFLVFATQNPIEQEGTYPLPEAQLDRFMFQIDVGYPTAEEEIQIVGQTTSPVNTTLSRLLAPERIIALQDLVLRVPVADHVVRHAVSLVRATRPGEPTAPDFVKQYLAWGAGPRASQNLVMAAKARAVLMGRFAASIDDIRALAMPVLVHRMVPNFHAQADGLNARILCERLLQAVTAE